MYPSWLIIIFILGVFPFVRSGNVILIRYKCDFFFFLKKIQIISSMLDQCKRFRPKCNVTKEYENPAWGEHSICSNRTNFCLLPFCIDENRNVKLCPPIYEELWTCEPGYRMNEMNYNECVPANECPSEKEIQEWKAKNCKPKTEHCSSSSSSCSSSSSSNASAKACANGSSLASSSATAYSSVQSSICKPPSCPAPTYCYNVKH